MASSRPNIWQLQSRRDVQALTDALRYPDPEVRKRAAVALRTLDAVQAVPALKAAIKVETNNQVHKHLEHTLHELDHRTDITGLVNARDVKGLIGALKSRHPEHIVAAAAALGTLDDRTAVEPLVILFHNSSSPPAVRLAAAEALLTLKSAPAVVTLLGALRRDSWQVRRNAAAVLGQIQATWAVEPLGKALDDPHPVVRRAAAAALRRIGTADAVAMLRARFATPAQPAPATKPQPPASEPAEASEPATPKAPEPAPPPSLPESSPLPESSVPDQPAAPAKAAETPEPPLETTDTRPSQLERPTAAAQSPVSRDTQPMLPTKPEPAPSPSEKDESRGARLTDPVKRLIAFFRQRTDR